MTTRSQWLLFYAVVLGLAVLYALACAPVPPHWERRCTQSHSETRTVYWPAESPGFGVTPYGVGYHVGGGIHIVTDNVCDHYDSTWVVPDTGRR